MPSPGSGANFNVCRETTTFNAHAPVEGHTQFPFVALRVILKKRTIKQKEDALWYPKKTLPIRLGPEL